MGKEVGKKSVRITVRFEPEEATRIIKEADKKGMTPSAYLRMMANQEPRDYPEIRTQLKQLINEVNHVGVNINQIVKNHNSGLYFEHDKKRLDAYMQKLNLTMKEAVTILGNQ